MPLKIGDEIFFKGLTKKKAVMYNESRLDPLICHKHDKKEICMKRTIAVILCFVLLALPLTSCGLFENDITDDFAEDITLNVTGKEAAELLLTRDRLNENAIGGAMNFAKMEALGAAIPSRTVALAATDGTRSQMRPLAASVEIDGVGGRFVIDGNTWEWSEFPAYSDDISFYESYVKSIEGSAESFAKLIHTIKSEVNITDRWVPVDGRAGQYLLTVGEMSETVFEREGENIKICNHYADESGHDVYEMYSRDHHANGDLGEVYAVYVDGAHYEFAYDYTPADGDPMKYFRPRVIVENSRGYWNMLCLSDVAAVEEDGQRFPRHYNLGNLIAKDGVVYQVQVDMQPGTSLSESFYGASIISADWGNDIVSFYSSNSTLELNIAAFDGIKALRIDDVTALSGTAYNKQEPFGDPQYPAYSAYGTELVTELTNGTVLREGDTFADGQLIYLGGEATFGYGDRTDENETYDPILYVGKMRFAIDNASSKEVPTTDELARMLSKLFSELGITPKYSMDGVVNAMKEAAAFTSRFGQYYEWNGYKVETVENLIAANDDYIQVFDRFETLFAGVKDLPWVDLNDHLEPLPESLDFADFSGYSYGKITVNDGVITAEEMIATLPEHVLLDEGSEYVLRLGLRKYQADGVTPSETLVVLHGDRESYSTFEKGKALSFIQASNYTIPSALSEGKYLLVAFAATAEEGIRVSKTVPLASVDFTVGTVESEIADITYEKIEDDQLIVVSRSKLYAEVALDKAKTYDATTLLETLTVAALSKGIALDGAALEAYDPSTGQATPLAEGDALTAGTYRLKYASPSHGNADAFVYCTVSADMIAKP